MFARLSRLPFFVVLMGLGALAMLVPSAHGLVLNDFNVMRVFFYGTILFGILTLLIGLATAGYSPPSIVRSQLVTLAASFTVLPILFAIPLYEAVPGITFLDAWFEMVSSFTTTGATLFDIPQLLSPSLHLWRALVGWMGGLLIWVTALAILAPMNLGGFEVRAVGRVGPDTNIDVDPFGERVAASERLANYANKLFPIYFGLTMSLWFGLVLLGDVPYVALIHAMSVMSTSGISAIGGLSFTGSGIAGEILVFGFFIFAITRLSFSASVRRDTTRTSLWSDPEVRVALSLIIVTSLLLILRHFFATAQTGSPIGELLRSSWGAIFTVTSFLTTTGFESRFWLNTSAWTGVQAPGIVLLGLAMIGGGVATTAGGAKLFRVYALYRHSEREMGRLLHPSSVGGGGKAARQIRKQGAYISWVFFMLLAVSIMAVMLLLSLTGVEFEAAMILSVAALSTTGPLASVFGDTAIAYSSLTDLGKVILAAAMVLGRLETLALIALFNPDFWRG